MNQFSPALNTFSSFSGVTALRYVPILIPVENARTYQRRRARHADQPSRYVPLTAASSAVLVCHAKHRGLTVVRVPNPRLSSSGSATSPKVPSIVMASGILFHFHRNTALGRL